VALADTRRRRDRAAPPVRYFRGVAVAVRIHVRCMLSRCSTVRFFQNSIECLKAEISVRWFALSSKVRESFEIRSYGGLRSRHFPVHAIAIRSNRSDVLSRRARGPGWINESVPNPESPSEMSERKDLEFDKRRHSQHLDLSHNWFYLLLLSPHRSQNQ